MVITYRLEKGLPLTWQEGDDNFRFLDEKFQGYQPLAAVLTNTTASFTTDQERRLAGLAELAGITPDVSLPFGNTIKETLSGEFLFTRASASGYFNKSNQLGLLANDEIAIGVNGASFYQSYSNYFNAPQAPVTQVPTIPAGSYTLWITGAGSAATIYGTATEGDPITFTSAGEALTITISGTVTLCNLINLNKVGPPILDAVAPAIRAAEPASFQAMNNIPAAGLPFTLVLDCAFPAVASSQIGIQIGSLANNRIRIRANPVFVLVYMGNGTSEIAGGGQAKDGLRHRYALVFTGAAFQMYVDGLPVGTPSAITGATWDVNEQAYIGATAAGGEALNSELEHLFVYPHALSADAMFALGGPA